MKNIRSNGVELLQGEKAFLGDFDRAMSVLLDKNKRIAVFGGTYVSPDSDYYKATVSFTKSMADAGFSVITGGGPGVMEAANRGAHEGRGASYGLLVKAISNEKRNAFIDDDKCYSYETLSIRLLTLISSAEAIVFFPGGYGTLEEFFSLAVRIRLGMVKKIPVYLVGKVFWRGLFEWIKNTVLRDNLITEEDYSYYKLCDDIELITNELKEKLNCKNL